MVSMLIAVKVVGVVALIGTVAILVGAFLSLEYGQMEDVPEEYEDCD